MHTSCSRTTQQPEWPYRSLWDHLLLFEHFLNSIPSVWAARINSISNRSTTTCTSQKQFIMHLPMQEMFKKNQHKSKEVRMIIGLLKKLMHWQGIRFSRLVFLSNKCWRRIPVKIIKLKGTTMRKKLSIMKITENNFSVQNSTRTHTVFTI